MGVYENERCQLFNSQRAKEKLREPAGYDLGTERINLPEPPKPRPPVRKRAGGQERGTEGKAGERSGRSRIRCS